MRKNSKSNKNNKRGGFNKNYRESSNSRVSQGVAPAKGGNGKASANSSPTGDNIPLTASGKIVDLTQAHRNDYDWINKSPIASLAYSIQYNKMPGYNYDHTGILPNDGGLSLPLNYVHNKKADGAVMRLNFVPVLGDATSVNSPVNQSFTTLYSRLIQATNSGNVGFNQATMSKMLISLIDIVGSLAHVQRVLHLINKFERANGFYPKAVLESMGYDYRTLQRNKPLYESEFQTLIQNFNHIGVPEYSDLFARQVQLNYSIYHDENAIAGMPYYFHKEGYYKYMFTEHKVQYFPKIRPDDDKGLDYELMIIAECMEALRNTDDLGLVMGAIRRAFPESAICTFPTYNPTTVIEFHTDRDVTYEVNNCWILPITSSDLLDMDITEDPELNVVYQSPRYDSTAATGVCQGEYVTPPNSILNCYDAQVGDQFAGCATWFIPHLEWSDQAGIVNIASSRTELLVKSSLYQVYLDESSSTAEVKLAKYDFSSVITSTLNPSLAYIVVDILSKIKHAPRIYITGDKTDVGLEVWGPIGDYQVVTTIEETQIDQTHLAALQSMYLLAL